MSAKVQNAKLPGRFEKMTKRDLDAVVAELERPIALGETRAMTLEERRQWRRAKRQPGLPAQGAAIRRSK